MSVQLWLLLMAINCDPSTLANNATCFSSCIPMGDQLAVQTYLLAQIALNSGVTTTADPSALAALAASFMQTIPQGMQLAVQNYLLCQLVNK